MKEYKKPELAIWAFNNADVITASDNDNDGSDKEWDFIANESMSAIN